MLNLTTSLQPMMTLAVGAPLSAGALSQFFDAGLTQFDQSQDTAQLLESVEKGLREARQFNWPEAHNVPPARQARLAYAFASLNRQVMSFSHNAGDFVGLQSERLQSDTKAVINALDQASPIDGNQIDLWSQLSVDLMEMGASAIIKGDDLPLITGLGAIGLGLGTRMALKMDAAVWFANLMGNPFEGNQRVHLYGHRPPLVDELNDNHFVALKMHPTPDEVARHPEPEKMEKRFAWAHHGIQGIHAEEWMKQRSSSHIQLTAVTSTEFVNELIKNNYAFFRDLPEEAILISPIKSQIPEEMYREMEAQFREAYFAKYHKKAPNRFVGGASMEEIYHMIKVITDRQDIKTVHVGGLYFADDLYLYPHEPPRKVELVFASRDLAAAEEAARWLRVPGEIEISVTDDVSTVLLGGVIKNIFAYDAGSIDIRRLNDAYQNKRRLWSKNGFDNPGENGIVTQVSELVGDRRDQWESYKVIAQALSVKQAVTVPAEILRDFCACTSVDRRLLQDLFWRLMKAKDSGDREAFRKAILAFKRSAESDLARSRNRRGGLLHALAIFVKMDLESPEEAQLLYTGQTIEGYKALYGLHSRLQERGRYAKGALSEVYERFYTQFGVPKHPEFDPLVPQEVRDALLNGIHYTDAVSGEKFDFDGYRLHEILLRSWVGRPIYEFISSRIVNLADHLVRERKGPRVVRDFRIFEQALSLIDDDVAIEEARYVTRIPVKPYYYVNHFTGRLRGGQGDRMHYYRIGLQGNQDPYRLRDVLMLLAHHQAAHADERFELKIHVEGAILQPKATSHALEEGVNRYRRTVIRREVDGTPVFPKQIDVHLGQTEVKGLIINTMDDGARPDLDEASIKQRRYGNIHALAALTSETTSTVEQAIRDHTEIRRRIIAAEKWVALVFTGRGRFSSALRDSFLVPGEYLFGGIAMEAGEDLEDPAGVFVANFTADGDMRVYDRRVALGLSGDSNPPQVLDEAFFAGYDMRQYIAKFEEHQDGPIEQVRVLPIKQFPLETILVGDQRRIMRSEELAISLANLGEEAGREFFRKLAPYHFAEPDDDIFEDIKNWLEKTND